MILQKARIVPEALLMKPGVLWLIAEKQVALFYRAQQGTHDRYLAGIAVQSAVVILCERHVFGNSENTLQPTVPISMICCCEIPLQTSTDASRKLHAVAQTGTIEKSFAKTGY